MRKLNKRKVAWIIRELGKGVLSVGRIAQQQGVTPRWARELRKRYEREGCLPVPGRPGPTPRPINKAEFELIKWFKKEYGCGAVSMEKILRSMEVEMSHNRIHKIMKAAKLAKNEPKKQKQRKWVRWERKHSNSLWHTDWYEYKDLHIVAFLDDASRLITGVGIFDNATAENALMTFNQAIKDFDKPQQLLSDHGSQFTADIFKERLSNLGIKHIKARIKHPQTNGKMERWFQTLKHLIEHFKDQDYAIWFYNNKRPHMSLEKSDGTIVTPIQAFHTKKRRTKNAKKNKNGS